MTYKNGTQTRRFDPAAVKSNKERDYWLQKLSGQPEKITFPYEPGKAGKTRDMHTLSAELTGPIYSTLMKISNNSDVRLHIILVAGWLMLLNKYTGSSDIIVGIPTYKQETEGQLINTVLALRNKVTGEMTVKELLLQVGETVLEANRNQNYPINTLLYKLKVPESGGDFPLFDISILLEDIHHRSYLESIRQNMIISFSKTPSALQWVVEYNRQLYSETFMNRIITHFQQLLHNALADVDIPIGRVDILSERERKQLVKDFNDNAADFPRDKTVPQFIEEQAEKNPDRIAVIGGEQARVTYRHLNEKSGHLAHALRQKGVMPETIVAIMMERSVDIIVSILGVWKAGGAYLPIDPTDPQERIDYLLADSGAEVLLTGNDLRENLSVPSVSSVAKKHPATRNSQPVTRLAYIIYTSGSTGKPKGAMLEHIGMMNHIQSKINLLGITDKSIVAQNTSQTFDISVWQFFTALVQGGQTVIYPDSLVLDAAGFISLLIKDGITILEVVPSYLSVVLDVITSESMAALPFLMLDYLLVTGEEVKPKLVKRWFETYPHIKMVNAYGPTEASDDITHYVLDKAPADTQRIPIGKPVQNLNIYIVDDHMNLCPVGVKGEIWVSGIGVGRGYLKNEEKTRQAFMEDPFNEEKGLRLYKTGDLGCWRPDGTIDFFGRKDYQVKIMGVRIELGEIENQLLTHPEVKEAVVIDREDEKFGKYLCAYIVGTGTTGKRMTDTRGLRDYLLQLLPDYMIPAHFIPLEKLPLTANGKIDRKALPAPGTVSSDIPYISGEMLDRLVRESTGVQGVQKPVNIPGQQEKPARQSIDAAVEVEEEHAELDRYSKQKGKTYYPLSHTQKQFYYHEKAHDQSFTTNIFFTVKYPGVLDPGLLNEAINNVLLKNAGLRLRIVELIIDSGMHPAQYVSPYKPYPLDFLDFSRNDEGGQDQGHDRERFRQWVDETANKPFQLIDSDLFYFAYIKYDSKETGYCFNFHHLVFDGWSQFLVMNEIHRAYHRLKEGKPVNDEANPSYIQYLFDEKDYLTSPKMKEDRAFWHKNLLPLPPEAVISSKKGNPFLIDTDITKLPIPGGLSVRMREYCETHKTSIFKLVLSALSVYVSRVTGLEDFIIGSINHGRAADWHKQTAGVFVDFFPIRVKLENNISFHELVQQNGSLINYMVKHHTRYPYDILAGELREITGKDTWYFGNINLVDHPNLQTEEYTFEHHPCHRDPNPLNIHIFHLKGEEMGTTGIIELEWEYQVERFSYEDIERIYRSLLVILADVVESPGKSPDQIDMLSEEDKQHILYEFNDTTAEFPADKTLYQLFEEQVIRTPGNPAIGESGNPVPLTYDQLNRKSNQLARYLRTRGVTAGSTAAIMVKRSFEMIIAMLAVMKAGGAYMAVGLTFPDKRIDFMCRDSGAQWILTDKTRELPGKADIMIDVTDESLYQGDPSNLPLLNTSRDLAAVFYTSGSTGLPKGVLDEHRGLVNRLWWIKQLYPLEESDVILQQTPVIFDVSVWELFGWSFQGASLYLLGPTVGDKAGDIVDAVIEGRVTHMHIPPVFQFKILDYIESMNKLKEISRLKLVLASGEALLPAHVNSFNRLLYRAHGTRLINLYGPTEASIEVSYFDCASDREVEKVPIGKPIHNIQLLIVDKNLRLVPVGVPGQLCIAGVGLARGYLNSPELTAEKFVFYHEGHEGHEEARKVNMSYMSHLSYIYQTGDLTRWLPDGNIEFLGRIDEQVQLGGIRIEPGEVESILLKHKDINEAVVVPMKGENDEPYLCAFVKAAGDLSRSDFREVLARELPRDLIPGQFVELEKIPLTPTGKVNRKVLEVIDLKIGSSTQYVAPKTEIETKIAAIWKEVLHIDKVSIHDNFFDIGGNSLGIIQVNFKLKEAFNREIPALIMFEHPTIASIIDYLEKNPEYGKPVQEYPDKDRSEIKDKGKNRMQQKKDRLKQVRNQ